MAASRGGTLSSLRHRQGNAMTTITAHQNPPKIYDRRWRLNRVGIINVWHYLDNEFSVAGGRLILRGSNGSGKSRALEMLLPYLLDADRRRMDATGSNKVSLDELMRTGSRGQKNRIGYLWMELAGGDGDSASHGHLTIGAHVKYSESAHKSEVTFFTTNLRVGNELQLMSDHREPLSRDRLSEHIGAANLSKTAEQHREVIRNKVFGLQGDAGRDRFIGLVQLLHTLRSPDVGNRIDEGKLPQILSDALPPLGEQTLLAAGEQLDGLTETQQAQQRLEATLGHTQRFLDSYRSYAAKVILGSTHDLIAAAKAVDEARTSEKSLADSASELSNRHSKTLGRKQELGDEENELVHAVDAIKERPQFEQADALVHRDAAVDGKRSAAMQALTSANLSRTAESQAAQRLHERLDEVRSAVSSIASTLADTTVALVDAGVPYGGLPVSITLTEISEDVRQEHVMDTLDALPTSVERPVVNFVELKPSDLAPSIDAARLSFTAAQNREVQAERRRQESRRLDQERTRIAN